MKTVPINLAVALPAEAKALIRSFGLRRLQPDDGAPPLYLGARIALVLTGVGAEAMARGVVRLYDYRPDADARWLNLGIAGHGSLALGSCLLAQSVTDRHTLRHWSMHPPALAGLHTAPLHCVREAVSDYAADTAYDMESGGFTAALERRGALQRADILKIVSDGPNHSTTRISARMVDDLVQRAIPLITTLIDRLHDPD
jgi:adenosylhomocysteine nucleosidase